MARCVSGRIGRQEERLLANLSVAMDDPLGSDERLNAHRTTGTELLGADAYLGTETKLAAVGEGGGRIPIDAGGIYEPLELKRTGGVVGDDTLAVT